MNNIDIRIHALIDMIDLAWEQNASEKARMLAIELEKLESQRSLLANV